MLDWLKKRNNQILIFVCLLFLALGARLVVLSVVQNDKWSAAADSLSIKTVTISAPRGEIRDRNGKLLAGNAISFVVEFSGGNFSSRELNEQALELLTVLEKNGDAIEDDFPIVLTEDGQFAYTYQQKIEAWLREEELPETYTALMAFNALRNRYGIDDSLDQYDAQAELQNTFGVYPPITVRLMKFTESLNLNSFLDRYANSLKKNGYDETVSAEDCFRVLRGVYKIDESLSDADARKILIIRDALNAQGYISYVPITVAKDASEGTIVTIQERCDEFPAVDVVTEYVRTYPNGTTASHVLGYLGKISESDKSAYLAKGYSSGDLIGKDGIERTYESALRGTDGIRTVEADVYGKLSRVIDETEAKKGETVYLTLDLDIQKTMEEALQQALEQIQTGGTFESEWGSYSFSTPYKNATVGASVAIDVKTAEVLAMASYPGYDPNLFATGITQEDWDSLQAANARDPLSPRPLYNVATRTSIQPGSSFKIVTSIAALESGLNPSKRYLDGGAIEWGNRTYGCVIWNRRGANHGYINLYEAIGVSCNYFFYDLISNTDWTTGQSMGLSEDMGIYKVLDFAEQFGLGHSTGIQIPESVNTLPSAEKKLSSTEASLKSTLKSKAAQFFTPEVMADEKQLEDTINIIVGWCGENPTRAAIVRRFADLPIQEDKVEELADLCKYSYFNMANWTLGDYFNIAIGQGENAYTPLQVANMVATLGNGGLRNSVSVVKTVGDTPVEKEEPVRVQASQKSIDAVIQGMIRVAHTSGGSGYSLFRNFPVTVAAKTGTAQRSGKIQPPDEVEFVRDHLRDINRRLAWEDVENEMQRLLREDSSLTTVSAVHQAVINLSNGSVTDDDINDLKDDYDNFAWFVGLAPADDPQIAVATVIFNGGSGGYAGTITREVIGAYLNTVEE